MKPITFAKAVAAAAVVLTLISSANAIPLSYGDIHSLGSIEKGTPDSDANQVSVINVLVDLVAGDNQVTGGYTYDRTSNFQPGTGFTDAVVSGAIRDESNTSISLGTGYLYLLAKYGNQKVPGTSNPAFYVWYVGDLSGDVSVPEKGLSHISLYNPGGSKVPDGGLTVLMLGSALAGLGTIARRIKK